MSNINFLPPSNFNENLHVFSIITLNIISFNQNKIVSLNKNSLKKKIFAEFKKKRERFITVLYRFFNRGRKKKRFKKEKQHT